MKIEMSDQINPATPVEASVEEQLVAELKLLDIGYLSRQAPYAAQQVRPAARLMVDLLLQSSARVRLAVIAVLLAHPECGSAIPAALEQLMPSQQLTLKIFCTAALLLQEVHAAALQRQLGARWQVLPDYYSAALGVPSVGTPLARLVALGHIHRQMTGLAVNWTGTYENVAAQLLRRWELECQWKP